MSKNKKTIKEKRAIITKLEERKSKVYTNLEEANTKLVEADDKWEAISDRIEKLESILFKFRFAPTYLKYEKRKFVYIAIVSILFLAAEILLISHEIYQISTNTINSILTAFGCSVGITSLVIPPIYFKATSKMEKFIEETDTERIRFLIKRKRKEAKEAEKDYYKIENVVYTLEDEINEITKRIVRLTKEIAQELEENKEDVVINMIIEQLANPNLSDIEEENRGSQTAPFVRTLEKKAEEIIDIK